MKQRENSTRAKSAKKMRPASGKKKKWVIIYKIIKYLYFLFFFESYIILTLKFWCNFENFLYQYQKYIL